MKKRRLLILGICYGLIVAFFCIYLAENFARHTTYKGDHFFLLVQYLLILTYVFMLAVQFTVKSRNYLLVLAMPIITCISSFFIGLLLLLIFRTNSDPKQKILIYGILYGLMNIGAVYKHWILNA